MPDTAQMTPADADEVEKLAREARAAYDETWPKGDSWLNVARFILTRERETLLGMPCEYTDIAGVLEHSKVCASCTRVAALTTILDGSKT
jgi:hypothetical protein